MYESKKEICFLQEERLLREIACPGYKIQHQQSERDEVLLPAHTNGSADTESSAFAKLL